MLNRIGTVLVSIAPTLFLDLVGLIGVGLIAYGSWLVYEPAGFIVAGVLLVIAVILVSVKPKQGAGN